MNKEIMSYWLKLYDENKSITWEGIVNGKIGGRGELIIDPGETDPSILDKLSQTPYITTSYSPAWEVVYLLKEKH